MVYCPELVEYFENDKANRIRNITVELILAIEVQDKDAVMLCVQQLHNLGVSSRIHEEETVNTIETYAEWASGQALFLVDKTNELEMPNNQSVILFTQEFGRKIAPGQYKLENMSKPMENYILMRKAAFELRLALRMPES